MVYIADGCEPHGYVPSTLLISSPRGGGAGEDNRIIYHEFQKDSDFLYMPLPTPQEVLLMRKHCFAPNGESKDEAERAEAAVLDRMARWGPIPRYVLARVGTERAELEATIALQSPSGLREFVQTMSELVAARSVSFRVVHYDISADFTEVTGYRWASPHVGRRVVEVLAAKARGDRFELLAEMLKSRGLRGMSGALFEEWCGLRMTEGGDFRIRRLGVGIISGTRPGRTVKPTAAKQQQLKELLEGADRQLGLVARDDGSLVLSVKPASSHALRSVNELPTAASFEGRRFRARTCFPAVDFIEANGVCANATVQTTHSILLLG
jgi:hypothetical protein